MESKKQNIQKDSAGNGQKSSDAKKHIASDCVIENITLTNIGKILFPESGITKWNVVEYYQKVSMRMLHYICDRVLSIVRCPGGVESACYYRKHPAGDKSVVTVPLVERSGKTADYFYIKDVQGLVSEVQMDTLEFHVWGSRVDALENPDVMVFDLDPDAGMAIGQVRQGVRDVKRVLDEYSLTSYLKTSGGKGYHIVIPLQETADWETFHTFAGNIAKTMEQRWPDRYTSNSRKEQRNHRIFVDWLRNARGATTVAPYSIRAREGAPVSMPITWEELDTITPRGITMAAAVERLNMPDPWESFCENPQQLPH